MCIPNKIPNQFNSSFKLQESSFLLCNSCLLALRLSLYWFPCFVMLCVIVRVTSVGDLYGFDDSTQTLVVYVCISCRGPRHGEGHRMAAVVLRDRFRHPVRSHYGSLGWRWKRVQHQELHLLHHIHREPCRWSTYHILGLHDNGEAVHHDY